MRKENTGRGTRCLPQHRQVRLHTTRDVGPFPKVKNRTNKKNHPSVRRLCTIVMPPCSPLQALRKSGKIRDEMAKWFKSRRIFAVWMFERTSFPQWGVPPTAANATCTPHRRCDAVREPAWRRPGVFYYDREGEVGSLFYGTILFLEGGAKCVSYVTAAHDVGLMRGLVCAKTKFVF